MNAPGRLFYGFEAETVFDPQPPIDGESLLGWIGRTTLENELPNITTILRDVGQVHRNRTSDVMKTSIDVEGLATILGADLETVRALRAHDLGDGTVRYLGATVQATDVHTATRRFAPASLGIGPVPIYRASWLFRTFPVCTLSWQALRSACDCGSEQTWATFNSPIHCEACGGDLRDLPGESAPPELHPGLSFLADILFGDEAARHAAMSRLPDGLRSLDPADVYEVALLIARIVDPTMGNPREKVWRDEPMRLARALAKSADLLLMWPEAPWLALGAAGDVRRLHPRSAPLVALYRIFNGEYGTRIAAPIRATLGAMRESITIDGESPVNNLIDLDRAVATLGVTKSTIRKARRNGHIKACFVIRGNDLLPGYDRAEVEAMAKRISWPSASRAGRRLGLAPYAVEQLCAMEHLVWAKAPQRTILPHLRVDPASMDTLERSLRGAAIELEKLGNPVALSTVVRGIGGREKPWGPILSSLADGAWPFALCHEGSLARTIAVDRADADAIRGVRFSASERPGFPFSTELTQADACDILNVPVREREQVGPFRVATNRAWVFDRQAVLDLAAEVTTSAELGARHFLEGQAAAAECRHAKLTRLKFGFERATAVAAFDAHRER